MATPAGDLGPASIVVITAAKGIIVNGLKGTGVVMSLPSVLTADSASITPLYSSNMEAITPPEPETIQTDHSAKSKTVTHKVIFIAVAVGLGLTCTIALFVFIIACWRRRKVDKVPSSMIKSTRSSLDIRCIGIDSAELTKNISPVPPLKQTLQSRFLHNR